MTKTTNKHYYNRALAMLLALAGALALLFGASSEVWGQEPDAADEMPPDRGSETDASNEKRDSSRLLRKAEEEGSVRMIVGLQTDFEPEGKLSQARATDQREDIDSARAGLRAELEQTDNRTVREYETIPYVALEVSP
jgi:hypothetical protein